jgi:hypothetical protein
MYDDSITTTGAQELLNARMAQAEASLRGTPVVTREDLLATVYSALNAVLALGNNITPLLPVAREGPAIAGDLNGNFQILNQDAQAIIRQLIGTENDAATLFNLFASTQNNLRQTIREAVYTSGSRRYVEEFISNTKLGACSATVDFNAGVAALPLVSETFLQPVSIDFGVACVGDPTKLVGTTDLLLDGKTETSMTWIGSKLELVFNFSKIQVLNRLRIELAGYQGLVVEEFSSSPDGVIREDLLADLQPSSESLDGSSGKFSGDWIADFDLRYCSQVRLIVSDRVGVSISLRNIQFSQRTVSPSGQVQSLQITQPLGTVVFRAAQHMADQLTAIAHQVSTDNVHYQSVMPDQVLALAVPYWYRAVLTRIDANFDQAAAPLDLPGADPIGFVQGTVADYVLQNTATTDLGGGTIERTLNFSVISGPVQLEETPLDGTLVVFSGALLIPAGQYSMTKNKITFTGPVTGIMIRYQTSAFARAGLPARKNFYSPLLFEVRFERL